MGYLIPSDIVIVVVWHFNLTNNLILLAGFNAISYDLLTIR